MNEHTKICIYKKINARFPDEAIDLIESEGLREIEFYSKHPNDRITIIKLDKPVEQKYIPVFI
jgi:hypothetical protein